MMHVGFMFGVVPKIILLVTACSFVLFKMAVDSIIHIRAHTPI